MKYNHNSHGYIYNSYLQAKAMKTYNHESQKRVNKPYYFIYMDLVSQINSISFSGKKYFFIFEDNITRMIKIYISIKKND